MQSRLDKYWQQRSMLSKVKLINSRLLIVKKSANPEVNKIQNITLALRTQSELDVNGKVTCKDNDLEDSEEVDNPDEPAMYVKGSSNGAVVTGKVAGKVEEVLRRFPLVSPWCHFSAPITSPTMVNAVVECQVEPRKCFARVKYSKQDLNAHLSNCHRAESVKRVKLDVGKGGFRSSGVKVRGGGGAEECGEGVQGGEKKGAGGVVREGAGGVVREGAGGVLGEGAGGIGREELQELWRLLEAESKEYRKEYKRTRDRLVKRIQRSGGQVARALAALTKQHVQLEMLTCLRAKAKEVTHTPSPRGKGFVKLDIQTLDKVGLGCNSKKLTSDRNKFGSRYTRPDSCTQIGQEDISNNNGA